MKLRILIATAAMVVSLAPASFAAQPDSMQQCANLEKQFDQSVMLKETSARGPEPTVERARELRRDGAKLCSTGDTEKGLRDLQQALKTIDVTPAE